MFSSHQKNSIASAAKTIYFFFKLEEKYRLNIVMELSDSDQDIHQKEDDAYAEDDLPDLGLCSCHQV